MTRAGVVSTALLAACLVAPSEVRAQPSPADVPLKQGREALERTALVEALSYFRRATSADPNSSASHRYQGEVAEMLGEFGEALDAYRAAARLSPGDDAILRLASLAERMGLRKDAIAELQRWLPRAAREGVAEFLFRAHVESGDRAAALALARTRKWVHAGADYCGLPVAGIGQDTRALLAMLLHPSDAVCAVRLATSLTDGGQAGLARIILSELSQKAPPNRAQILQFMKIGLPAHDVPPIAEALNVTAYRLATRHRHLDEAIEVYKRAIAADPKFSWPLNNLGTVYAQRGQIDDALETLRRAVAANPDHWRAHVNLGGVAMRARRWDEALTAYARAIALNPGSAVEFVHAGRLMIYLGRREEGVKVLQHALTLNRSLLIARNFLNTTADRVRMVGEMLDVSGVQRSLPHVVPDLRAGLEAVLGGVAGASSERTVVRESVEAAITGERMLRLFTASAMSEFDSDRTARVLTWWRSPVGARIRQMEHDSLGVSLDALQQYAATLGNPAEVLSAMRRLDAAQQATESQLDVLDGMNRGVSRVLNPLVPADRRRTKSDLERDRQAAHGAIDAATALRFAHAYRTATPEEIAEYLRFLASDDGRWFTTMFRQASGSAVEILSEEAAQEVLRRLAKQPPPPGTKETR